MTPIWQSQSLRLLDAEQKYDGYFPGHDPVSNQRVGLAFAKSVEGAINGQIICVD
jgi:hypothetical protein